jgi:hypothetical protein
LFWKFVAGREGAAVPVKAGTGGIGAAVGVALGPTVGVKVEGMLVEGGDCVGVCVLGTQALNSKTEIKIDKDVLCIDSSVFFITFLFSTHHSLFSHILSKALFCQHFTILEGFAPGWLLPKGTQRARISA